MIFLGISFYETGIYKDSESSQQTQIIIVFSWRLLYPFGKYLPTSSCTGDHPKGYALMLRNFNTVSKTISAVQPKNCCDMLVSNNYNPSSPMLQGFPQLSDSGIRFFSMYSDIC